MSNPEQYATPTKLTEEFDFSLEHNGSTFDINAAFQEAMTSVVTNDELALDEKVRRMEIIVNEGASEIYREFIDFREMAARMEMMCNHDHTLNESMHNSETLSGFMSANRDDGHDHGGNRNNRKEKADDGYEIDPKTGKKTKKKKRYNWLDLLLKRI